MKKLARAADGREVRCCYEAGPCGYALQRQIEAAGPVICEVIAPALIPRQPGDRIKTDRRDARKLAEMLRAGLLTEVQPPTPEQEAVRDRCRAREDAKADLLRCRHRLNKMRRRRGLVYRVGKKAWTGAHRQWLRSLQFDHASDRAVLQDYVLAIEQLEERLKTLEQQLTLVAEREPVRAPVGWLRGFRGIDTVTAVTAVTVVAEWHGVERFQSPRELMAYVGLGPSAHSSSDRTRRGGMTKAGNSHARRVLLETSWHYRLRRASVRLSNGGVRDTLLRSAPSRKKPTQVVVACAREPTGFLWAALLHDRRVTAAQP